MERKRTWLVSCVASRACLTAPLLCLLIFSVRGETCPAFCTCAEDPATVTCLDSPEIELPLDVSQWTSTLILRGANISALRAGAFSANGSVLELRTLRLSWNNIHVIEAHAFRGLPRLQRLDLSHNRLAAVSVQAFCGLDELHFLSLNNTLTPRGARELPQALSTGSLRHLQTLELSGNRLTAIPIVHVDYLNLSTLVLTNNSIETIGKNDVSSLSESPTMRVFLSLNPFECGCELEAFYYWLRNDSRCPDSARVLCKLPEARSGLPVEKLRKEDFDCANAEPDAELEAVSYVFLGIVLALIGVVFLMVLYLNRGGIKRWLNNIREACRDQMEVYHYRYEQDSDPRLANVAV
ncbi:wnt-activated inhibitory factor 2 [Pygocentrus nattereri]|uniref:LRRCT domain-containing protein n=1 Tax=Pygocentrus nattereri TaxID=42514 RepID=A0AAR2M5B2_PYGNA|nr:wnt-activated inhibitory factor 2 [Pygocentrus nattereri]